MNAAQLLIGKEFQVGSLQNPLLGQLLHFGIAPEGSVQILHSGGNH